MAKINDVITDMLANELGSELSHVLATRADIFELTQLTHDGALLPDDSGELSHGTRAAFSCRIAKLNKSASFESHFGELLAKANPSAETARIADLGFDGGSDNRVKALIRHVDLVASAPKNATRHDVELLQQAGISDADIVRLSELVAFVSYQIRVVQGLRLLAKTPSPDGNTTATHNKIDLTGFTTIIPEWKPYVTPVDLATATPEQLDALKVTPSNTKVSDYVLVLAHDVETLKHRSPLFNGIMYNRGGLSRAEREIGAVGASIVNHCIYCAAVHASRYNQLSKEETTIASIFAHGAEADVSPRLKAILNFSVKLSACPSNADAGDITALTDAGLGADEILDLILSSSLFGWANRLMHTLGEPISN